MTRISLQKNVGVDPVKIEAHPKRVPWDQNFGLHFFLMSSPIDVLLLILLAHLAKSEEKLEKGVIFSTFFDILLFTSEKAVFLTFHLFLQNNPTKLIK